MFLPLKKPKGQRDYSYSVLPPLYEFAEKKNHIKKAIHINEDSYLFKKKAVAIMNYYQKIGYCDEYYLYTLQDTNVKKFFQTGTLTKNSERNPVTVSLSRLDGIYLQLKK